MGLKTTFNSYVCFYSALYDTKPDSDDDSGIVEIPTVTLDGTFTLEDLRAVLKKMEVYCAEYQNSSGG